MENKTAVLPFTFYDNLILIFAVRGFPPSVARYTDLSIHVRISEIYPYVYEILYEFLQNMDFHEKKKETKFLRVKYQSFSKNDNISYFQLPS